jgi:hypothetical protein
VISVGPFRASGLIGWFAWLGIHIAFLTTFRNRAGAILTWTLAFGRESRRERAFSMQRIVAAEDIYPASPPAAGERPDAGKQAHEGHQPDGAQGPDGGEQRDAGDKSTPTGRVQ